MNRELALIEKIYDHIEAGDTDKAVSSCLRLSKTINDTYNTIMFLRELYPDKKYFGQLFLEETQNINQEGKDFIWSNTLDYWLDERTSRFPISDSDPDKTILALGVGEMKRDLASIDDSIRDLRIPNGLSEYDILALSEQYDRLRGQFRLRKTAIHTVLERINVRCLAYASRIEKQISNQEKPTNFLTTVQTSVNNYFATHSEETYRKLQAASNLITSDSPEDHALLLTAIRRAISSAADHFLPPSENKILCSDGIERELGAEQYINRLGEFCSRLFYKSTSSELFKGELNYFMTFAKKLNEIASKGVHTEVTPLEAKQGLLGLYLLLSNIIERLTQR